MKKRKVKKKICPICGSAAIKPLKEGRFVCRNCKAIFKESKIAEFEMEETPSYIG